MDQATIFCIGIVAGGILFTLLMYILSSKYLQGDFMKLPTHDGHDSDNFSDTDKDLDDLAKHHVSPFEVYTEKSVSKKISTYGFESTFTAEACLKVTLEYKTRSQCLLGNILSLEKLDLKSLSTPKEIRFHVKLVPGNKHARKTQFKGVESRILALTFTMGKFTFDELKLYKLCIRVYGRRGPLSRSHCFGECYINLNFVSTPDEVAEFSKKILPKVKQSTSLLLSDSETDNDLDQMKVDEIYEIAEVAENDDETRTDEIVEENDNLISLSESKEAIASTSQSHISSSQPHEEILSSSQSQEMIVPQSQLHEVSLSESRDRLEVRHENDSSANVTNVTTKSEKKKKKSLIKSLSRNNQKK